MRDVMICQHCKKEYKYGGGYEFKFKSEAWGFGSCGARVSLCRKCSRKFVKEVCKLNEKITGFSAFVKEEE